MTMLYNIYIYIHTKHSINNQSIHPYCSSPWMPHSFESCSKYCPANPSPQHPAESGQVGGSTAEVGFSPSDIIQIY